MGAERDELREQVARLEERVKGMAQARDLAAEAIKAWQASANEWRGTVSDLIDRFVSREMWEAEREAIRARLSMIEAQAQRDAGKGSAYGSVWLIAAAVVGWGLAVVGLILRYGGGQ